MSTIRHLIIIVLVATYVPAAPAQQPASPFRIDTSTFELEQTRAPAAAQMHPAAKAVIIGGAVGAGSWLAIGAWYCTIGPNEAGECSSRDTWVQGIPILAGAGAAIGALIGAMKAR